MARKKAQQLTAIMVRLPAPLHRQLVRLASAGGRSLNSEVIRRLADSVAVESPLSPDARRMLDQIEKSMERRAAFEAELLRLAVGLDPAETKRLLQRFIRAENGEEGKS
jgi:hypothetical protein